MIYLLIAVDANGRVRIAQTTDVIVPEDFVRPGEIAFVVEPIDVKARHAHEVPA